MATRRSVREYNDKIRQLIAEAETAVRETRDVLAGAQRAHDVALAKLDALEGALELSGGHIPERSRKKKKAADP